MNSYGPGDVVFIMPFLGKNVSPPIQLHDIESGKAIDDGPSVSFPTSYMGDTNGVAVSRLTASVLGHCNNKR